MRGYFDGVTAARADDSYRDYVTSLACVVEAAGGSVVVERRAFVDPPEVSVSEDMEHGFINYTTRRTDARAAK